MKTAVILQPGYLPWLGFFDQMAASDYFVLYDDVQYDKNGWRNRNRIRTEEGWQWLTVPVLTKGKFGQKISEVEINSEINWREKHLKAISQHYQKSPHFTACYRWVEEILTREWEKLLDLDMAFIQKITDVLGIRTPIHLSSGLPVSGSQTERLVNICKTLEADVYLTGDKASQYLDTSLFNQAGIQVQWHSYRHPGYRQCYEPFIPYLSVLDLIFNEGPESRNILTQKRECLSC